MGAALATFAFLGGMIAGSFVSVVAYRVPRGESIVGPRSQCPDCGSTIAAYDNVPVFSWLMLRGHCRNCHGAISARYPLVELGLGALFAAAAVVLQGDPAELAMGFALLATLAAITLTDLERRVIPNAILAVSAVIGIGLAVALDPSSLGERAIAAVGAGGFLLLAAVAYPKGMGMGDVKLAAVIGLYLGRAAAPAMLVALVAGALVGIVMILRDGPEARKRALPFGPFLALGAVVGLLAGNSMLDWYLNTFAGG
jgi:leader peptidase (prepilin peptidase)/N-methyltransferase